MLMYLLGDEKAKAELGKEKEETVVGKQLGVGVKLEVKKENSETKTEMENDKIISGDS